MIRNSTLLFIMDSTVDESQFINVDEMLDPLGKCSIELEKAFKSIDFSPSKEVISNILMNA
jgi:hypothetical protein